MRGVMDQVIHQLSQHKTCEQRIDPMQGLYADLH